MLRILNRKNEDYQNKEEDDKVSCRLYQNSPNPFCGCTIIKFYLSKPCKIRLVVCDLREEIVRNLHKGLMPAGEHCAVWDGTDDVGKRVESGNYGYRLEAGECVALRKLTVL